VAVLERTNLSIIETYDNEIKRHDNDIATLRFEIQNSLTSRLDAQNTQQSEGGVRSKSPRSLAQGDLNDDDFTDEVSMEDNLSITAASPSASNSASVARPAFIEGKNYGIDELKEFKKAGILVRAPCPFCLGVQYSRADTIQQHLFGTHKNKGRACKKFDPTKGDEHIYSAYKFFEYDRSTKEPKDGQALEKVRRDRDEKRAKFARGE
jgi:hypothetical protein